MSMVQELENLTNEELTNLVKKESLNRFIYIQFQNSREFKKAGNILWDEKLPFDLVGFHAFYTSKVVAQYLKKVHGLNFYETSESSELVERYDKGLVR